MIEKRQQKQVQTNGFPQPDLGVFAYLLCLLCEKV